MKGRVSVILTTIIAVLAAFCSVMNIMGENYVIAVIWGAVAVLNIISALLKIRQKM